jgi:glutamate/tyrosine decarboxylase-like PLP-dependent enzyme
VAQADSVSIDPHKLGYVPYPAGAVLVRERSQLDAVGYDAPYLWRSEADGDDRDMGRNTLEGSRPRAMAAACWLAHRAIPLSQEGHGKILAASLLAARELYAALESASRLAPSVKIALLNNPHTNVVCYLPYHLNCRDVAHANALCRALAAQLSGRQNPNFSVAQTSLRIHATSEWLHEKFVPVCANRFATSPGCGQAFDLTVLRSVVMGPAGLNASVGSSSDRKGLFEVFAEDLLTLTERTFASV